MTLYQDLGGPHGMPEDDRIDMIGHHVMVHQKIVGVMVDAGNEGRYIGKLKAKFPGIRLISHMDGPVEGAVFLKFGPPPAEAA